jgi:hypothetical protein
VAARVLNYALLFIVGLIVGTVGTIAQQSSVTVFSISLPFGIIASLLAVACLLVGLRLVNDGRSQVLAAAVGVVIPVVLFSLKSAGGSVLVPNDLLGYIWIFGPPVIAIIVLGWPPFPPRRARPENRLS